MLPLAICDGYSLKEPRNATFGVAGHRRRWSPKRCHWQRQQLLSCHRHRKVGQYLGREERLPRAGESMTKGFVSAVLHWLSLQWKVRTALEQGGRITPGFERGAHECQSSLQDQRGPGNMP